jgi:hypothetical protein
MDFPVPISPFIDDRVSSAKGVHLAEIFLRVTKTEKCTRCVQGIAKYPI